MRKVRSHMVAIRFTPVEVKNLRAACVPLGMSMSTYVRTVILRELAAVFPDDQGAKDRMMEQIAQMAGEVVRAMTATEAPKKK